ncbi:hypothetical protein [Shewanella gaetbuli]
MKDLEDDNIEGRYYDKGRHSDNDTVIAVMLVGRNLLCFVVLYQRSKAFEAQKQILNETS